MKKGREEEGEEERKKRRRRGRRGEEEGEKKRRREVPGNKSKQAGKSNLFRIHLIVFGCVWVCMGVFSTPR